MSSPYGDLVTRGDVGVAVNPVPRGLPTRRSRHRGQRGVPLVRGVRRLPRVLEPGEVEALVGALRTRRDQAMVHAMVLGGLRRCEVLGLRLEDLRLGEWRVFTAEGKGGHQRLVPVSKTFFASVADYLNAERPARAGTDRVFVALKGPRRGQARSSEGLDEVLAGARARAGLTHGTCHELRHTCFTRLREGGMAIEALQAQAGHASIASTRIYLHLSANWLAGEYPGMRAGELGSLAEDAMVRIGDAHWLRLPVGKLHDDRDVPLHPLLVTDWRATRGPSRSGRLVERDDGQPYDRRTIHRDVAARRAGVGHVHPTSCATPWPPKRSTGA